MPDIDVTAWARDRRSIALAVTSAMLPGLFTKSLDVPEGAACLVRTDEDGTRLEEGGETVTGTFEALLVKAGEVCLPASMDELLTEEGLDCRVQADVRLRIREEPLDLEQLWENVVSDGEVLTDEALLDHFRGPLREAFGSYVRERSAEELYFEDQREPLEEHLSDELAGACFSAGIEFAGVQSPEFECPAYDELRKKDIEARVEAEELRQRQKLVELSEQVEKREELKRHQVEEFRKILEAQGMIKELEAKSEIDRKRVAAKAESYEELCDRLGGDEAKALVFLLEDDQVKADLIESLIERDMTEEQIQAKKADDVERKLDERLHEMSARLADFMKVKPQEVHGPRTRRLLCVLGKQVLAFQPTTNVAPEAPKEVHENRGDAEDLGYLRSVRVADLPERSDVILAGAQRGVYVFDGDDVQAFPFSEPPEGKGGVNSIAAWGGYIYATHSEIGLTRWQATGVGGSEPMHAPLTHGAETTRGVLTTPDGVLYFATQSSVYGVDLKPGADGEPVCYRGAPDAVTALCVGEGKVFAGTKGGEIYIWKTSDPAAPERLKIRKSNPIYMLRLVPARAGSYLLVGAKAYSLTAHRLGTETFNDYRAPEEIRWVDGAVDRIYGVSRAGYTVHVWELGKYDEPVLRIRVADRIQDIWVARQEEGA